MDPAIWLAFLAAAAAMPPLPAGRAMRDACVVTALNPKSIVAFVPRFLDAGRPVTPRAAILVATFVTLAGLHAGLCALLAARLSAAVRRPRLRRAMHRAGGAMLLGAGLAVALRRT